MSSQPIKIDGIGTRKSGADASNFATKGISTANFADYKRFVKLFAAGTISKGDAVCIDFTTSTNGLGNHVVAAKSGVGQNATTCAIGVADADAVSGDIVSIQVSGIVTTADIDNTDDAPGDALGAGANAGRFTIAVAGQTAAAILVTEGTPGSGDTTVYLLNPANL